MAQEFNTDICVIGAGPGGCAIAKRLADLGHAVTVVEAKAFPRPHVGICLSDQTDQLLNFLGAGQAVRQAGFLRRKATVVRWDTDEPKLTPQPGIHVDRGIFDGLLLENARTAGAKVIQPARVKDVNRIPGRGWEISFEGKEEDKRLTARFLVDAAGKSNVLTAKRIKAAPPLFALHAYWTLEETPNYDGFIEAGNDAWLWFALTRKDRCLISLFADPKHFAKSESESLESHYKSMMEQFSLMQYARLGERIGEVKGCDASSRYSTDPVGEDYIRVGDANFSVDPMSSQGVHLALASGVQAAVVVNSLIRFPSHKEAALRFFKSRQEERVKQFTTKSQEVYQQVANRRPEAFWHDRAGKADFNALSDVPQKPPAPSPGQKIKLSPQAEIQSIPVMQKDHIQNAPALFHPSLERPVAFLAGQDLVELIRQVESGKSLESLGGKWSSRIPAKLKSQILQWLWEHEIIVPWREGPQMINTQHKNQLIPK